MAAWLRRLSELIERESSVKAIYKSMPTREVIVKWVRQASKEFMIEAPEVRFHERGESECEDTFILLMSPEFWNLHAGPDSQKSTDYWITVFHEFSHWAVWKMGITPRVDHAPEMYAFHVGLCLRESLPFDRLWSCENWYAPGSLKRGARVVGTVLLENFLGRSLVTKRVHQLPTPSEDTPLQKAAHRTPYPECVKEGCADHPWVL